jgi:hypothetical protein
MKTAQECRVIADVWLYAAGHYWGLMGYWDPSDETMKVFFHNASLAASYANIVERGDIRAPR